MNKPLPHLTIRTGPWAGTMVRFATVEQLRTVQKQARVFGITSEQLLYRVFKYPLPDHLLNTLQPKES